MISPVYGSNSNQLYTPAAQLSCQSSGLPLKKRRRRHICRRSRTSDVGPQHVDGTTADGTRH